MLPDLIFERVETQVSEVDGESELAIDSLGTALLCWIYDLLTVALVDVEESCSDVRCLGSLDQTGVLLIIKQVARGSIDHT